MGSPEWGLGVATSNALGYIWTGSEGQIQDPVTLLLLKSTQSLLASGESWGLWGFLYLLGCKYFMRRQKNLVSFLPCTLKWGWLHAQICQKEKSRFVFIPKNSPLILKSLLLSIPSTPMPQISISNL